MAFEDAVEPRNGAEPGSEHDLRNAPGRIIKQGFGFLDAHASNIFGKRQSGGFLEELAEVKSVHMHVIYHLA